LGHVYSRSGQLDKARGVLARLDDLAVRRPVSHFSKALVHAGLGETELALACLEKAYEESTPFLYFLKTYPWFENLRKEPRFKELVLRVGLPE
jgi:hypothetical protein